MVNNHNNKYPRLEKTLTIAGTILIFITIIATLFSAWNNRGFVYEPLDVVYYLRYLLILCGGYFIGYIVRTHKSKKPHNLFSFDGVLYSLLAILIFFLLDLIRIPLRNFFGFLPYPWEKIIFEGAPLITLAVVAVIAIIFKKCAFLKKSNHKFEWLFIILFIIQQIGMYIYPISISILPQLSLGFLWTIALCIINTPLAVAIVTYLLLGNIKESLNRVFYSSIVGTMYGALYLIVWEFRTNPMADATEIFSYIATISVLVLTAILIWRARKTAQL